MNSSLDPFLSESEMSTHMRQLQWDGTPLGLPNSWPPSLRSALGICLGASFPVAVYWGRELALLYNDPWSSIPGKKHPWALGRPARDVWPEIWPTIGPMLQRVLATGEAIRPRDQLLAMNRYGFTEECYFDYSFNPIRSEDGTVGGIFNIVIETTFRVISERRTALLRLLGDATAGAQTAEETCALAAEALITDPADLPFCLLYLLNPAGGDSAALVAAAGLPEGHPARPAQLDLSDLESRWPLSAALGVRAPVYLHDLESRFPGAVPSTIWPEPCRSAVIVPITAPGPAGRAGVLIAGLSSRLAVDDSYQGFIHQVAASLSAAVANADAYEEERRRSQFLAELDRAKSTFFSNVSHEFRTPLTLLLGPLDDLLRDAAALPPRARASVAVAYRNGLRLQRLVNSLLDFSRIEAGRVQAHLEPVDLAALTQGIASTFTSAMQRAGLNYTIDTPPLPHAVAVDREMWEKVVLNLLSNAFKFTLSGSVELRLSGAREGAELSVTDTGAGIPESELPHLFERFHRIPLRQARTVEGSGIGLALVHELVRLHNGRISASSVEGAGTTFTVCLPYSERTVPSADPSVVHAGPFVQEALRWIDAPGSAPPAAPRRFARGRILLADDNADMRDYLRSLLQQQYEVTAVANGREALESALAAPPDLVLTDVMMPELDGFALLQALRSHRSTRALPVLLLSARAGEEASAEGFEAGADDYIVKPFTARELLARVGVHLSRKQARERAYALLAQVFAQTPVSICVFQGPEFVIEMANAAVQALHAGRQIEGLPLAEVMPGLAPETWSLLRQVIDSGQPVAAPEISITYPPDGSGGPVVRWFNLVYQPLREGDGPPSGVIAVGFEITGQVRVRQELERVNRELEEFAYVASHDMQEPLRMINSFTQLLLRKHVSPANQEALTFAGFIEQGVHRMEQLIQDLLAYSRVLHTGEEKPAPAVADLQEAWSGAVSVLQVRIEESGATIEAGPLPRVMGDTAQLGHVFQNLLSNALKYCKPGIPPRVSVSAARQDRSWVIAVTDNGIGFDPRFSGRIFGLFKRLHRDEFPGTGLGLAICQRIVERQGGRIWAESTPDVGSTFFVALPAAEEE